MTRDQTPSAPSVEGGPAAARAPASPWWLWLGWAWVGVLALAAVAEIFDVEALRLALDVRRHV
jgi:hypothetical protein